MMVFIDTSAWISLVAEKDSYHQQVAAKWGELRNHRAGLVTSSDVCSETITYLRYNIGHHVAVSFYDLLQAARADNRLLIEWVTPPIFEEAWGLFKRYDDHKLSMVDCTSFAICRKRRIGTVLTLDKHFLAGGFDIIPEIR